jgi:hypothetical protein
MDGLMLRQYQTQSRLNLRNNMMILNHLNRQPSRNLTGTVGAARMKQA